jgi:putative transposase
MARLARVVVPGCWHHVTQRGNRQHAVFFEESDRKLYLELLKHHCTKTGVRVAGYCLMTNHVHVLAIPARPDGLALAFGRAHNDYARYLNVQKMETGHVWQNRYFSCPMDEAHGWAALRYVERNPVRAGLVRSAGQWQWSSAAAHLSGQDATGLLDWDDWRRTWSEESWARELEAGEEAVESIRRATRTGRPAGDREFVQRAEAAAGRCLRPLRRGRKRQVSLVAS